MKELGKKIKTLTRRMSYLRKKDEKLGNSNTSRSYDSAEAAALESAVTALKVVQAAKGDRAEGPVGVVYSALVSASNFVEDHGSEKHKHIIDMCDDALDLLEELGDTHVTRRDS